MSSSVRMYDDDHIPVTPTIVKKGMTGKAVSDLQCLLKDRGYAVDVDGAFGSATERAVIAVQRKAGLVVDGIVGEKTLTALLENPNNKPLLSEADLQWAAAELGVDLAAVKAVNRVESRGKGFLPGGYPVILYERHIMRRQLIVHRINPDPWMAQYPNIVNTRAGGYLSSDQEYTRLHKAMSINKACALESASWGCFQIMGYHWNYLGYDSVQAFITEMQISERKHLEAFVRFIQRDKRLLKALREKEWVTFARWYNGPNHANNQYAPKLLAAYQQYSESQFS